MCDTASFDLAQGCTSKAPVPDKAKSGNNGKNGGSNGGGYGGGGYGRHFGQQRKDSLDTVYATDKIENPDVVFNDFTNKVKCFDAYLYYISSFDL